MPPAHLAKTFREWRRNIFSELHWVKSEENPIASGEGGGYRVKAEGFPLTAYLKPIKLCAEHEPRAANEKIVSDLGSEVGLSIPPVLLHTRQERLINEEHRCCVSLIMYPIHYPWGFLGEILKLPEPVQHLVRDALSRYSKTFALDLLVGQTDRNNDRNVALGVDNAFPANTEFLFLDHAFCLNYGNRWDNGAWKNLSMVPIPDTFKASLRKDLVLQGADEISSIADDVTGEIVQRVPEEYMCGPHKRVVIEGLNGRKRLVRTFVEQHL